MILRFLSLFPLFRALQADCTNLRQRLAETQAKAQLCESGESYWRAKYDAANDTAAIWRTQCEKAEAKRDAVIEDRNEKLTNAADSLALRLTGRRLLSKAPVEAPPTTPSQPINISPGSGKRYAGDVAREANSKFFERMAQQAGVIPDPKPN